MAADVARASWTERSVPVPSALFTGSAPNIKIKTNEYPSDSWRTTLVLLGKRRADDIIRTTQTVLTDAAKWATSIVAVENSNFLAIGSAARTNNLFISEASTKPPSDSEGDLQSGLQLRSAFSAPNPIYTMSVAGSKLVTGGPDGRAQLFELQLSELGQKGRGLAHSAEIILEDKKLRDLRLSPPGAMVATSRVQCIEFAPTQAPADAGVPAAPPERFLASIGRKIYIHDLNAGQTTSTGNVCDDTLLTATWNPHLPVALICAAGTDGRLNILDSRLIGNGGVEPVIWKAERAHKGSITDVKFNPFIPYWLASAGMDSVVKMWDIRYSKHPVGRIDGHYHGINSIAWSNSHCDILSTVSSDRSWRAWSFAPDTITARDAPSNMFIGCPGSEWGRSEGRKGAAAIAIGAKLVGECDTGYTAPILKVISSKHQVDTYYTISAVGELCSHTILGDVFEPIIPHRFEGKNMELARDIERSIYVRDMSSALTDFLGLCRAARKDGRLLADKEQQLLELCTARPPIPPTSWSVPPPGMEEERVALSEAVMKFQEELREAVYFLPPSYGNFMAAAAMIMPKLKLEFERTMLRCNLVTEALIGGWENIVKAEKMLCKGMELDQYYINSKTLQLFLQSVLPHDLIKGLTMGLKFCEVIEDTEMVAFSATAEALGLLLFPTAYDSSTWLPASDCSHSDVAVTAARSTKLGEFAGILLAREVHELETTSARRPLKPLMKQNSERGNKAMRPSAIERTVKGASERRRLLSGIVPKPDDDPINRKLQILRALAEDPIIVLPMVKLEIRLVKAINNRTLIPYDDVIKIFEAAATDDDGTEETSTSEKKPASERTISAYANQVYLDALLANERWLDYCNLCFDLVGLYAAHDFSRAMLAHAEAIALPKIKVAVDTFYSGATAKLATAMQLTGATTETIRETLLAGIALLRDGIVLVVKIGACMAKVGNGDKERVGRIRDAVLKLLGNLNGSLFRTLDVIDRMLGGGGLREAAQMVQSAVRDASQALGPPTRKGPVLPSSTIQSATTPTGPQPILATAEMASEVAVMLDQLSKIGRVDIGAGGMEAAASAGNINRSLS
ncbi:hypothetical protein DFS34DRAFT_592528 [Phlyctochytrium arcticum]|nr:hypothetical protein DFS34DRAFT_592528 [Phlyctochytrium arcticum]